MELARTNDPLQMRVEEAKQRDIGKKRARIGPDAMDYLKVSPGDVIQITGKKSTCAIVWPSDEDEKYPDTIRIDGQTRNNTDVGLNDTVGASVFVIVPLEFVVLPVIVIVLQFVYQVPVPLNIKLPPIRILSD